VKWNDRIGYRLKLHNLHVLLTVVEVGSMARAARQLAVSQPSVSKAISDLEHTVGVRLLDRTPRGVECTASGRALLRRGMGAFDELRQGMKDIESLADPTAGEVRIACPEAIASGLLSAVVDRFIHRHPNVVVSVTGADNKDFRLLRDRSVDFLLGGIASPFGEHDLEAEPLYRERLYIVAAAQSRWARRRKIRLAELAGEPWLFPGDSAFNSLMTDAFKASGVNPPKASVTAYSIHQRVNLLASGSFVSVLSDSVLRQNAGRFALKVLPVDFVSPTWQVGIVTLKRRTISPAVQTFIECIRDVTRSTVAGKSRVRVMP
jgi:DNA-binding transcriptional LysR family regulator